METLKEKTAKGIFWGGLSNGLQQFLGMLFGIILGRILLPEDYGMVAMLTVFTAIANNLQNSGFSTALANLKQPTHKDYNSVFWFNILMSLTCYVVLFFCAPLIARYYHEPRLVPLCRYSFLGFVIASLGTAQSAYLFKNLRAKQQAKAGIAAVLLSSAVGVTMAWQGAAYWALATQSIVYVAICVVLNWHYSDWRPTFDIDFSPVRRMFGFSSKVLLTGIVTQVNNNVLNVLLGRYFSPHATGCYNQASQWNSKCNYVVQSMVAQVAQPVLVEMRGQEERQLAALRKLMRFTAFLVFPLMFGLGLVSHEFIVLLIKEKWVASAALLQILVLNGAVTPLCALFSNTVLSRGRSDLNLWLTASLGVVQIVTMVVIWPYGIQTMVVVYALISVAWLFVWHAFVWRLTGYRLSMFLKDIVPFAFSALTVMLVVHFATASIAPLALLLAVRIVLAALLYYAVMKLARVQILRECEQFVLGRFRHQH